MNETSYIEMKPKTAVKIDANGSNKKVYYGDDGQIVDKPVVKQKVQKNQDKAVEETIEEESADTLEIKPKKGFKKYQRGGDDLEIKWYQVHEEHNTSEFKEIKDSELSTLQQLCRTSFNDEIQKLAKSEQRLDFKEFF